MTDYIGTMDVLYPGGQLQRNQAGVHIRGWKQAVYNTLKNCTGEVTCTHTELNYIVGATTGFMSLYVTDGYSLNDYYIDGAGSGDQSYARPDRMLLEFHATNTSADPDIRWYVGTTANIYDLKDRHGATIAANQIETGKVYSLALVNNDYWILNL